VSTNVYLDQREAELWIAYRRMNRMVQAAIATDLGNDSGLSESDYDVLSTLTDDGNERMRILDLGTRLQWSKSRISNHLTRMEKRGLVTRETCDTDGRGAFIQLTAEGRRTIVDAAPSHVQSVRKNFLKHLTPPQRDSLRKIAGHLVDQLDRTDVPAS
jgi:DNA-binding MarR family transcriptional regulator